MHITDGRTKVMPCVYCNRKREPTQEEVAAHPNLRYTPEQLAVKNAMIEDSMRWLRDNGYINEE
jgi:hypothetical protein